MSEPTTTTLDAPGAVLTYDVRSGDGSGGTSSALADRITRAATELADLMAGRPPARPAETARRT